MSLKTLVPTFLLALLATHVFAAPPANDNFNNAQVLTTGVNVNGTLSEATREPGDYDFGGSGYVPPTAWYQWTPAASGVAHVSVVFQSAQRHGLQAFAGGSLLGGKFLTDDGEDSYLYVVAGHTYHVSFDGASQSGFTIGLASDASLPADTIYIPPLSNDDSAQPAVLPSQSTVNLVAYTFNATFEPGEYAMLDGVGAHYSKGLDGGVWMDWTAPVTGSATYSAKNLVNKRITQLVGTVTSGNYNLSAASESGVCPFNCQQGTTYRLYLLNQASDGAVASITTVASGGGGGGGTASSFAQQKGVFAGKFGNNGFISIALLATRTFTGTLILDGVSYSLRGVFKSDGNYAIQIGKIPFILSLHLDLSQAQAKVGDYVLTGSANNQSFSVNHATYASPNLALEAGRYTLALAPAASGATLPTGSGYASLTVTTAGAVRLAGRLADGELLSAAGSIVGETNGKQFVIGKLLVTPALTVAGTKGLTLGAFTFRSMAASDFDGSMRWTKPAQTKGLYSAAIDTTLNITGARYTFKAGDSILPGFVNGVVALSDTAALNPALNKDVTLTSANGLLITNAAADKLTLVVNKASGLFTGSFIYPGATVRTPLAGVLNQKNLTGGGYFHSPAHAGKVDLTSH